jgi:hypothetical protein
LDSLDMFIDLSEQTSIHRAAAYRTFPVISLSLLTFP